MSTAKKWLGNLVLMGISIALTIFFIDVLLHYTNFRHYIYRLNYPQGYFVKADAELGYDIAKNFGTSTHYFKDASFPIFSNNIGCFDRDFHGETPYVYLAGDSLTWSFTPFADTWGERIENLTGVRTVKCGVVGYGTKQQLLKASSTLANYAAPKLIVVGYTAYNDPGDDTNSPVNTSYDGYLVRNLAKGDVSEEEAQRKYAHFDRYCTLNESASKFVAWPRCLLSKHSILYNIIKMDLRAKITESMPGLTSFLEKIGVFAYDKGRAVEVSITEEDDNYRNHLANVAAFRDYAHTRGSEILYVLGPYDNEKIIGFLEKEDIHYIDLNVPFDEYKGVKQLIWPKDGHYNIEGNHLIGLVVSKYALEHNLIDAPNKDAALQSIDSAMLAEFGSTTIRYRKEF